MALTNTQASPTRAVASRRPELGIIECLICGRDVTVLLARSNRPFFNCGHCAARVFYNGLVAKNLLTEEIGGSPIEWTRLNGVPAK